MSPDYGDELPGPPLFGTLWHCEYKKVFDVTGKHHDQMQSLDEIVVNWKITTTLEYTSEV